MRTASLLFLVIAIGGFFVSAQDIANVKAVGNANSENKLILVDVTVTDKFGGFVSDMKAEDFTVLDEKELLPVTFFSAKAEPASVGILIDVSGSIPPADLGLAYCELVRFMSRANPKNEYFAMTFSETFQLLSDLTNDQATVAAGLMRLASIQPRGNTRLLDAIKTGLETMERAKHRKRVLIVLGDASENSSKARFDQIKWLTRESNVLFYGVTSGFRPTREVVETQYRLEELAKLSGGAAYFPRPAEFTEVLERIALGLDSQYVIGFAPLKSVVKDRDEWRKIKVKIQYKGATVRAREGYYAPRN